jgi:hypothetical protein
LDEFRIFCPKFPALSDRDAWENKNISDFSPNNIAGVCCQRLKCRSRPLTARESERGLICPHHPNHHDGVHQKRTLHVGTGNIGRRQTRSRKIYFFQIGVVEFGGRRRGRWPSSASTASQSAPNKHGLPPHAAPLSMQPPVHPGPAWRDMRPGAIRENTEIVAKMLPQALPRFRP